MSRGIFALAFVLVMAGLLLAQEQKSLKLTENLQKYIKEHPNAPDLADAYFNLGAAYYEGGEYKKAIEPMRKALDLRPSDSDAHYTLGNA